MNLYLLKNNSTLHAQISFFTISLKKINNYKHPIEIKLLSKLKFW